jgi:ribose/xylose/arabinose/galactoside ABC-type transport system permease subunit
MTTADAAWFVGTTLAVRLTSVQADTGAGQELIHIVATVIGGCLVTGGFGCLANGWSAATPEPETLACRLVCA